MDKFTFNRLVENPALVKAEHVKALQKIVEQYPYSQPAKILLTKAAHIAGHMTYEKFLHQASAGMADRKKLKYWMSLTEESVVPVYTPAVEATEEAPVFTALPAEDTQTPIKAYKGGVNQDDVLRNIEETLSTLRQSRNKAAGINKDDSELVSVPKVNIFENVLPYEQLTHEKPAVAAKEEVVEKEKEKETNTERPVFEPSKRDKKVLPQSLINDFIKTEHPKEKPVDLFAATTEQTEFFDYKEYKEVQHTSKLDRVSKDKEKIDEIAQDFPASLTPSTNIESSQSGDLISSDNEAEFMLSYLEHNKRKRRLKNISKDKVNLILNKFIQEEPSIKPASKATLIPSEDDLSEQSSKLQNLPASENFAQLLILQGKYSRAIEVFEELILKNPGKKPYFVSRIEELKNNLYT